MDASSLTTDGPLPDDAPTLQALLRQALAELARLRAENAELKAKLDQALKHRFGRRSERRRPGPGVNADRPARWRDEHGRSVLPEHLPRREVVHDLTEAEKLCPCCGQPRVCIGEQAAEQLDLGPARSSCYGPSRRPTPVGAATRPRSRPSSGYRPPSAQVGPIPKGLCGPGLLAHVITAKFADHTPLHRLATQLARSGVAVARTTLGDWLRQAADLLEPLYLLMHRRLLLSRVIHGDDTSVKLRVEGSERTAKRAPLGGHRRRRLSVCGVRLHGGLHGSWAGTLLQ